MSRQSVFVRLALAIGIGLAALSACAPGESGSAEDDAASQAAMTDTAEAAGTPDSRTATATHTSSTQDAATEDANGLATPAEVTPDATLEDDMERDSDAPTPRSSGQEPIADAAVNFLAARLDVAPDEIEVVSVTAVDWRDGSLGCPEPGQMYTQAIVPGYRVTLAVGDEEYHVHTDRRLPDPTIVQCNGDPGLETDATR